MSTVLIIKQASKIKQKMNTNTNPKKVWTNKGTGIMLSRRFGVTPVFVSMALNGKSNSQMARNIRAVAIKEYGGKAIE